MLALGSRGDIRVKPGCRVNEDRGEVEEERCRSGVNGPPPSNVAKAYSQHQSGKILLTCFFCNLTLCLGLESSISLLSHIGLLFAT